MNIGQEKKEANLTPRPEDRAIYPRKTMNEPHKWNKSSYHNVTSKILKWNILNSSVCITKMRTKSEKHTRRIQSCRRFKMLWKDAKKKLKK